jgi:hypothetical protein
MSARLRVAEARTVRAWRRTGGNLEGTSGIGTLCGGRYMDATSSTSIRYIITGGTLAAEAPDIARQFRDVCIEEKVGRIAYADDRGDWGKVCF